MQSTVVKIYLYVLKSGKVLEKNPDTLNWQKSAVKYILHSHSIHERIHIIFLRLNISKIFYTFLNLKNTFTTFSQTRREVDENYCRNQKRVYRVYHEFRIKIQFCANPTCHSFGQKMCLLCTVHNRLSILLKRVMNSLWTILNITVYLTGAVFNMTNYLLKRYFTWRIFYLIVILHEKCFTW